MYESLLLNLSECLSMLELLSYVFPYAQVWCHILLYISKENELLISLSAALDGKRMYLKLKEARKRILVSGLKEMKRRTIGR